MPDSDPSPRPEDDMLPDEREVIADRIGDLEDLDEDEFLTVSELADELGFNLE